MSDCRGDMFGSLTVDVLLTCEVKHGSSSILGLCIENACIVDYRGDLVSNDTGLDVPSIQVVRRH